MDNHYEMREINKAKYGRADYGVPKWQGLNNGSTKNNSPNKSLEKGYEPVPIVVSLNKKNDTQKGNGVTTGVHMRGIHDDVTHKNGVGKGYSSIPLIITTEA